MFYLFPLIDGHTLRKILLYENILGDDVAAFMIEYSICHTISQHFLWTDLINCLKNFFIYSTPSKPVIALVSNIVRERNFLNCRHFRILVESPAKFKSDNLENIILVLGSITLFVLDFPYIICLPLVVAIV